MKSHLLLQKIKFGKIILVVVGLIGVNVFSQEIEVGDPFQFNLVEKMFLQTPEQASLMKFIDIPVGNHTGVHGFSVPIYTIAGKDFSLPISIIYHGGGIKVDELSGSVGIGWSLSIGGISLIEEVRGERDLDYTIEKLSYFDPMEFNPVYGDVYEGPSADYIAAFKMLGLGSPGLPGVPTAELQPDYFSYSLINNSGKFIFDNNGKVHTVPKDNVIIHTPIVQAEPLPTKQKLTDSNGIIYHFSSYLQDHSPGTSGNSFVPRKRYSYKIDSIEIPNSGVITFEYNEVSYKYISSRTSTDVYLLSNLVKQPNSLTETISTITEYLPKSVTYNNVKVEFDYKRDGNNKFMARLDVEEGGNSALSKKGAILEKITVSDNLNGKIIKDFKLLTSYFGNTNPNNPLQNRFKLDEVKDLTNQTNYSFEYFGVDENKFLPPRFSFQQDYWGMYNGQNNSTSVPDVYVKFGEDLKHFPGANKEPEINFSKIGTLKKVKLPTGGYQLFEYELDEFKNVEFEDDDENMPIHNYVNYEYEIANLDFEYGDSNYNFAQFNIDTSSTQSDFREGVNLKLYFSTDQELLLDTEGLPLDDYYAIELYDNNNQKIIGPIYETGSIELPQLDAQKTYHIEFFKVISGSYTNPPQEVKIEFGINWDYDHVTAPTNRNAGSLRIKSIELRDKDDSVLLKKSYLYTEFNEISSGFFTASRPFPWVYFTSETQEAEPPGFPENIIYLNISDNAIYNLNTTFGKSVIYKKVTEVIESTDEGKYYKEYKFSTPNEHVKVQQQPILPEPHLDYMSGLLLEERWLDENKNLVKKIKNEYNYLDPDHFFNQFSSNYNPTYGFALSPALTVSKSGFEISQNMKKYLFLKNFNHVYSSWIKLQETTTENYENGNLAMTHTTEFIYDESNNEFKGIEPIEIVTKNSFGEEVRTELKYEHSFNVKEPTTIIQYENSEPKSIRKTVYYPNGLPKYVFAKKEATTVNESSGSDDLVATFDKYDGRGNLQQYTLANGIPVSIIWGYNGQYPIAKVDGKTYASISSLADTLINLSDSGNLTVSSFEALRNISDAMVIGYIYKPLVGITTIIQPNGQKETYEYDDAGRLIQVKDHEGNILNETEYHYYNQ